jgi:hypothetical protein
VLRSKTDGQYDMLINYQLASKVFLASSRHETCAKRYEITSETTRQSS